MFIEGVRELAGALVLSSACDSAQVWVRGRQIVAIIGEVLLTWRHAVRDGLPTLVVDGTLNHGVE